MDIYEQLRRVLDTNPVGAPASKYFDQILRTMYTEQEAGIAAKMSFNLMTLEKISGLTGIPVETLGTVLETMADKAAIFALDKTGKPEEIRYSLLPTIPGLFEFPFMKGADSPELKKLGKLWEKYHGDAMGKAFAESKTPQTRVIAVEESFNAGNLAHSYDSAAAILETADFIALSQCACRVTVDACDKERETCLLMNTTARFLVQRGFARQVDQKEALAVLKRCDEEGLVHTSNNSADRVHVICNCCDCCCTILRGRTQLDMPDAFATSAFIAVNNPDDCSGCGTCSDERCPVGAIELKDDVAVVRIESCIGCGLCVTGCPSDSMEMMKRDVPSHPINATARETMMKVLEEKGKTRDYLKIMER